MTTTWKKKCREKSIKSPCNFAVGEWTHLDDCRVAVLVLALTARTKLLLFAFDLVGVAGENHRIAVAGRCREVWVWWNLSLHRHFQANSPLWQRVDIRNHQNPVVILLCVVHHRVDAGTDALAPDIVITLSLQQEQRTMLGWQSWIIADFTSNSSVSHLRRSCEYADCDQEWS